MAKNSINQWTLTILRVVLGVIFAYHGYVKLFVKGALPGTAQFFSAIGIPLANYAAVLVAFVEFFGGLALILGVFTRWVSVLLILETSLCVASLKFIPRNRNLRLEMLVFIISCFYPLLLVNRLECTGSF